MVLASIENFNTNIARVNIDSFVLSDISKKVIRDPYLTWMAKRIKYKETPCNSIKYERVYRFYRQKYVNVYVVYEKCTKDDDSS